MYLVLALGEETAVQAVVGSISGTNEDTSEELVRIIEQASFDRYHKSIRLA